MEVAVAVLVLPGILQRRIDDLARIGPVAVGKAIADGDRGRDRATEHRSPEWVGVVAQSGCPGPDQCCGTPARHDANIRLDGGGGNGW